MGALTPTGHPNCQSKNVRVESAAPPSADTDSTLTFFEDRDSIGGIWVQLTTVLGGDMANCHTLRSGSQLLLCPSPTNSMNQLHRSVPAIDSMNQLHSICAVRSQDRLQPIVHRSVRSPCVHAPA